MEKHLIILLLCLILSPVTALAMGNPPPVPHVSVLTAQISAELYAIDGDLAVATQKLSLIGLTGDTTADILQNLYEKHASIVDCVTVSPDAVILQIEPERFKKAQGQNIGDQPHIIKIRQDNQPVLSEIFKTVEGFYAAVLMRPVISTENKTIGYAAAVFKPDALMRNIINPYIAYYSSVEATAIETDGHIIYDKDLLQIGKNTFTDPAYQSFTSLQDLARKITGEATGSGNYLFSTGLGNPPVDKFSEWSTISLHGVDWRIILSKNI